MFNEIEYFKKRVLEFFPNAKAVRDGGQYIVRMSGHPRSREIARALNKAQAWEKACKRIDGIIEIYTQH